MPDERSSPPFGRADWLLVVCLAMASSSPASVCAAGKQTLEEPAGQTRTYIVSNQLTVEGRLETAAGGGKAVALTLNVEATLKYRERRLAGTGRDAEALRSLRFYDQATAKIDVQKQSSSSRLRDRHKLIVAQGKREGVVLYSLSGPMSHSELALLRTPGDSLAALGLLPQTAVEIGEKWTPDSWVIQMLTGAEAVLKSNLSCELISIAEDVAEVKFRGQIEGATEGAATTVHIEGRYEYDFREKYIKRMELTQAEKRSVGSVSPGMDVVAKVVLKRESAADAGPLNDSVAARVPLEPDPVLMLLAVQTPWNMRFSCDRNWHVFHQTKDQVILRLLDKGSLIAQCNVSRISSAEPGKHTPEEVFQKDIATSLGEKLREIVQAEQLKTDDKRFLYRVTAVGESNGVPVHWIYYLCAGPAGRQTAFVFAVETKLIERLANRDLGIVSSLEFLAPQQQPEKAKR